MKLSVEGKVAASVAAAFVGLTVGVIAQGNNAGPTGYGPTGDLGVTRHISQHEYDSSLASRNNAEENSGPAQSELRD